MKGSATQREQAPLQADLAEGQVRLRPKINRSRATVQTTLWAEVACGLGLMPVEEGVSRTTTGLMQSSRQQ